MGGGNLQSKESVEILSQSDIPSSRLLFQLVPLAHRTEEAGSSSLLITPTAVMRVESPESMRARVERNGYKNGTKYCSLASQVMYGGLLPTPRSSPGMGVVLDNQADAERRPNLETVIARRLLPTPTAVEGNKASVTYNPNSQMGQSLSAMAASGMLPTPTARDWKNPSPMDGERNARKGEQGRTIELNDLIPAMAENLLPTPSAFDHTKQSLNHQDKMNEACVIRTISRALHKEGLIGEDLKEDGKGFHLSPLFTEEMMGFPLMWTTYPFLSQNGRTNPSRPTETQ